MNSIQIGTIAYKSEERYVNAKPLLTKETPALKENQTKLFKCAFEMFLSDLFEFTLKNQNIKEGKWIIKAKGF